MRPGEILPPPETARRVEGAGSGHWAQAPVPPRAATPAGAGRRDDRHQWLRTLLLAPIVATAGPLLRTIAIAPSPRPVIVAAAGIGASLAAHVAGPDRPRERVAIAAVGGAISAPAGGTAVGVWLALALLLADWAVRGWDPLGRGPVDAPGAGVVPALALSVIAAFHGRELGATAEPILFTGVALFLTFAEQRFDGAPTRLVRWLARALARVAATIGFAAIGVLVVVLPWVVNSVLRLDPLNGSRHPRWIPRTRAQVQPERPWARDTVAGPGAGVRLRRRLVPLLTILVLAGAVLVPVLLVGSGRRDAEPPPALDGADWWADYRAVEEWAFFDPGTAYNPLRYPPMADLESPHINVRDGARVSWRPPACTCHRLKVWVYGGSTVFGLGQRDDHTIPSELARIAAEDGLTVDVTNRGVLGDLDWESAQRFAWDATGPERPDLVVFYDGYNDIAGATYRNDRGRAADPWPIDWTAESFYDDTSWLRGWTLPGRQPDDAHVEEPATARLDAAGLAGQVVERHVRGRDAAAAVGKATGIELRWFWQPDRYTRPAVEGEPAQGATQEAFQRSLRRTILSTLPDDVVDLAGIYSDERGPIFYDDAHTGERGARIAAASIYASIAPRLDDLAAAGPEPSR